MVLVRARLSIETIAFMTLRFFGRITIEGNTETAFQGNIKTGTYLILIFQLNLLCGLADGSRRITKEYPWSLIDPQVHSQRTSIFGHKNSLPSNLRSQIFHIQFASIA